MGQTVDLPDPLQSTPGARAGSADDLLSQLAGEDIDRLMAEADGDGPRGSAAKSAPSQPPSAPPATKQFISSIPAEGLATGKAELEKLLDTLTDPDAAPAPAKTPDAGDSEIPPTADDSAAADRDIDQLLAAEAKAVLAQAAADEAAQVQEEEKAALAEAIADAPPAAPHPPAPDVETAQPVHGAAAPAAEDPGREPSDEPLPLLLRPLGWINAPLAQCSDTTRERVGKIAILTTVNALAILAYVAFFRRH